MCACAVSECVWVLYPLLLKTVLVHVMYNDVTVCTVEPLNNVTFGTSYSVHYREVSFLRRL